MGEQGFGSGAAVRAVLLAQGNEIGPDAIVATGYAPSTPLVPAAPLPSAVPAREAEAGVAVGRTIAEVERDLIIGTLKQTSGNRTHAATILGTAKSRIDLQKTFTTSLMDSIERGVGQLVDADMNKESTRLQALQVQQQLGIQSLSIANSNAQSILSLFRNG